MNKVRRYLLGMSIGLAGLIGIAACHKGVSAAQQEPQQQPGYDPSDQNMAPVDSSGQPNQRGPGAAGAVRTLPGERPSSGALRRGTNTRRLRPIKRLRPISRATRKTSHTVIRTSPASRRYTRPATARAAGVSAARGPWSELHVDAGLLGLCSDRLLLGAGMSGSRLRTRVPCGRPATGVSTVDAIASITATGGCTLASTAVSTSASVTTASATAAATGTATTFTTTPPSATSRRALRASTSTT